MFICIERIRATVAKSATFAGTSPFRGARHSHVGVETVSRVPVGRLLRNAVSMFVSGTGSAMLGLIFWGVASHLVPPSVIGKTAAMIAAMMLITSLAQLSFGSTFERFIPVAGDQTRAFILRAYRLCSIVALVLASAYVSTGFARQFLPSAFAWRAMFVVSVVLWTIFALQDSVLIGLRATRWVPVENILYSAAKLALLPIIVAISVRGGIFIAWMIPVLFANIIVNWYLFRRFIPEHEATNNSSERLPQLRELFQMLAAQYATLLVSVLSNSLVTLVVIWRLGTVANAHYYLPATIAAGAPLLVWSIYRSFLVEVSAEPEAIQHHARVALWSSMALIAPIVVIGYIIAPWIMELFGSTYADHGTALLRILLLSLPGAAIFSFYAAFAWIDRRLWQTTIREIASAIIYFVLIFTLIGSHGIMAIGIATFVRSLIEGALFLPLLIRRYRKIFA